MANSIKTDIYTEARNRVASTTLEQIATAAEHVATASKTRRSVREKTPQRKKAKQEYNHSPEGRKSAREREKRYRQRHPEKVRAKIDRWEAAHPESKKERSRKWRQEHPEKAREHARKFRARHKNDPGYKEKHNAYMREYRRRKKLEKEAQLGTEP